MKDYFAKIAEFQRLKCFYEGFLGICGEGDGFKLLCYSYKSYSSFEINFYRYISKERDKKFFSIKHRIIQETS